MARLKQAAVAAVAVALCACVTDSASRQATAQALTVLLASDARPAAERARDAYRHPKETLLFFGIRPQMSVLEVWPEPGWYTAIIAPLLRDGGHYTAAMMAPAPDSAYVSRQRAAYQERLEARPDLFDRVVTVFLPTDGGDVVPPGSLDMVVTFRNLHNWMADGTAAQVFASLHRALKPGGILGVVDHRGNPAVAQDPQARSGYVNEDYAIHLIEAQGFRLVAKSEVNANPRDSRDYPQGVWTLPPTYRLGERDRERYAAIGESDRFTLRFVKP